MIFFPIFLVFIIVTTIILKRGSKNDNKAMDNYIELENKANFIRKKDISQLDYIKIPQDILNPEGFEDEKLASLIKTLNNLSDKNILNLTGISNTDLKLTYGTANLEPLSFADSYFTTTVQTLDALGKRLTELEMKNEAVKYLEYAVSIKSDISNTYVLLANLYLENGQEEKIAYLKETAESLSSLTKISILRQLNELTEEPSDQDSPL